jgi:hypothetical protein
MATGERPEPPIREMIPEDGPMMASAFSRIGWMSKTVELFARYATEQATGSRDVLVVMVVIAPATSRSIGLLATNRWSIRARRSYKT